MKKFYKTVGVERSGDWFEIHLDGRRLKTPLKKTLSIPTNDLAGLIAAEWQAQGETIKPETLPLTRLANTAIDVTGKNRDQVIEELMAFAGHDLVCYRAEEPEDLRAAEGNAWDPCIEWMENAYLLKLKVTVGIGSIEQDQKTIAGLREIVEGMDAFHLTALHNSTTLANSLVLALALMKGFKGPDDIWQAAHVDEDYQQEKWGVDDEATQARAAKRTLFDAVVVFAGALRGTGKSP